jgi:hypothetical protein
VKKVEGKCSIFPGVPGCAGDSVAARGRRRRPQGRHDAGILRRADRGGFTHRYSDGMNSTSTTLPGPSASGPDPDDAGRYRRPRSVRHGRLFR